MVTHLNDPIWIHALWAIIVTEKDKTVKITKYFQTFSTTLDHISTTSARRVAQNSFSKLD